MDKTVHWPLDASNDCVILCWMQHIACFRTCLRISSELKKQFSYLFNLKLWSLREWLNKWQNNCQPQIINSYAILNLTNSMRYPLFKLLKAAVTYLSHEVLVCKVLMLFKLYFSLLLQQIVLTSFYFVLSVCIVLWDQTIMINAIYWQ